MWFLAHAVSRTPRALFVLLSLLPALGFAGPTADTSGDKLDRIRQRAEAGYIDQEIELAAHYVTGRGVPQDLARAAYWYQKAAEGGSPEAQNQIGYFYQKGIGVAADPLRSLHWFQLAASSGFAPARVNLGITYLDGTGVRRDPSTARRLFLEALHQNVGLAAAYLGDMAWFGLDGPRNPAAAETWFQQGANMHDPVAMFDLAWLFSLAPSHLHDLHRAAALFRASAAKGYVPAIHSLGLILVNQPDLAETPEEGATMLRESSQAGYWKSSVLLGILARDGRSMPADPAQACYYFHLAVLQGGKPAQELLANDLAALARNLPPQIDSARSAEAGEWFQQHRTPLLYVSRKNSEHDKFPVAMVADSSPPSHLGQ